jgi:hypothetical protein
MLEDNKPLLEDEKTPDTFSATLNQDGTVDIKDLTPETGEDVATSNYSALQAVQYAMAQEPSSFEDMIKLGISDRLQDSVEKRREEVAKSIFGNEDPEEPFEDMEDSSGDTRQEIDDEEEEE